LAVLLATPCSAPFVGVAISFALGGADAPQILLIFISMAIGLALPYLLLIIFPNAVKILPQPGKWMSKIKNIMAGFLAATAIWIIYILVGNIGFWPAMSAAILALLILPLFKKTPKNKIIFMAIFITIISAAFTLPTHLAQKQKQRQINEEKIWIKFDEEKIRQLVSEGKVVLIDITADWCITCKTNKLLVLNNKEIQEKIAEKNIIAMRGDLTKPNATISQFMQKHGRYAIPLNIVFGPAAPEGILTSEILNKGELLKTIERAK
jgi:suppressor for copper-sensitivity B